MNRRISLALILALLVQSLLTGLAMAWPAARSGGQAVLICTEEGLKEVALDDHGARHHDAPQAQPCCPCAIASGAWMVAPLDRLGAGIVYITVIAPRFQSDAAMPATARPSPQHSRAPPILS